MTLRRRRNGSFVLSPSMTSTSVPLDGGWVPFGVQDLPECTNTLRGVVAEPDNQVAKYAHAKVKSAAVQGDQARVTEADISNVENPDVGLSLQRIDGRWYVSELG
jgi:hypothetical protein